MTPDEISRIAGSLSKAQVAGLLGEGFNPADDLAHDKPGIAHQLHALGLTHIEWSPCGIAVRDHLKANPDG